MVGLLQLPLDQVAQNPEQPSSRIFVGIDLFCDQWYNKQVTNLKDFRKRERAYGINLGYSGNK